VAAGRDELAARQRGEAQASGRDELAARQRELVAALVAGADSPAGLDSDRVRAQAAALLRKRGRSVAHAQPDLAAALGPGFGAAFLSYARGATGPPPGCAADDAVEFARHLLGADGDPHPSAEVRRAARRVTRPRLSRLRFWSST
jgi:hypothetical protein